MKVATILFLFVLASFVSAQQPTDQSLTSLEPNSFTMAEMTGEGFRSFFTFSVGEFSYIIRSDGHAECSTGKPRPRNFDLRLGRAGHLVRVYFAIYQGDLLLNYEASDKQTGWGFVTRLDQKTLKARWIKPVNGFNIGPGLIETDFAYLTAVDLLEKLDLQSGEFVWQQQGFQQQHALSWDGFRLPSVNGEQLVFRESSSDGKIIEVDKSTGKILSVKN